MTQNEAVLRHLKRAPLDPLTALRLYKTMRLSARVGELKAMGHRIVSQRMTTRSGKTVARYILL